MRKKSFSTVDVHNFATQTSENQKEWRKNLFALFIQLADESFKVSKLRPEIMMRIIATNYNNNVEVVGGVAIQIEFQHP